MYAPKSLIQQTVSKLSMGNELPITNPSTKYPSVRKINCLSAITDHHKCEPEQFKLQQTKNQLLHTQDREIIRLMIIVASSKLSPAISYTQDEPVTIGKNSAHTNNTINFVFKFSRSSDT